MALNEVPPHINKIHVFDRTVGKRVVRYQLVVDAGLDRLTGQRHQHRRRFKTEREARQELKKLTHDVSTDSYVPDKTELLRLPGDASAKRLSITNLIPGHVSRTSLVIIGLLIFFIIFLTVLGLYAAIAGRIANESIATNADRPSLIGPQLCLVGECHRQPPWLSVMRRTAWDYDRIAPPGSTRVAPPLRASSGQRPGALPQQTHAANTIRLPLGGDSLVQRPS